MPKRPKTHNPFKGRRKLYKGDSRDNSSKRGYNYDWRKERLSFLKRNPLCIFCFRKGKITPATVVDHIIPHKGDMALFWDVNNWQPLCKRCHDSDKQRLEKAQYKD